MLMVELQARALKWQKALKAPATQLIKVKPALTLAP